MKNIYEILGEFEKAKTREDKINVLRKHDSWALKSFLNGAFNPYIKYVFDEIPKYSISDAPPGLGYSSIHQELGRAYLFEVNNPKVAPSLSLERKKVILAQMLEGLEAKEAAMLAAMFMKKLPTKGLTYKLVQEAFPGLLPNVE
jgi:hypothetical protein